MLNLLIFILKSLMLLMEVLQSRNATVALNPHFMNDLLNPHFMNDLFKSTLYE